jgi:hypothetical protein
MNFITSTVREQYGTDSDEKFKSRKKYRTELIGNKFRDSENDTVKFSNDLCLEIIWWKR